MLKDILVEELHRLGNAFGKSERQIDANIYFEMLNGKVSDEQMTKVANYCIYNLDKFPSIKQIVEVAKMFPHTFKTNIETCFTCEGKGTLIAFKDKYSSIFKCPDCSNCKANYPVWSKYFEEKGFELDFNIGWEDSKTFISGLKLLGKDSLAFKFAPEYLKAQI